ncbi:MULTISPECIES: DUF2768 family protein [Paenibacillus]|uniref:DUF2768 domain-containing protein n=2 Tax=Paenibacillus TaxID=44249 RepID=A0ABT4DW23_9BACL|nr:MULTISPECIES: DUF2768 family protein [Paenibacillus]MBN3527644.1 DUF2768 family protein [Paenibacillus apiarius]MCE5169576.1 DUF2768 domain-containing protein [Paenibacillus profundus]MCM3341356.1 DUF2768 domain-containing protein [Paenibacillus sp. MER TA 81-3]MCY9517132.1 DUF2768 domain-containing protein [Paenibacillus apiarius]MCY9520171.1 DUF2768 domain-containing protein [Paenibacillus apiarius]
MDSMTKMWVSFIGIGLMAFSAFLIMFARHKTKGWIRGILSFIAFIMLLAGMLYGIISIV